MPRDSLLAQMKGALPIRSLVFITGLRRIGKTTLLKLFIKYLIEKRSIKPSHILYVSLDDYLLSKLSLTELIEEYLKIHKLSFKQKIFLFLDEVAYQKDYEQQLKNIYDNYNAKVYASSSSATILASKKPYITGRYTIIEVLPLTFMEYLYFNNITIHQKDAHLYEAYFEEYLQYGGIPEYVLHKDVEYLKLLVDDIIYKDIAAPYNIKNPALLKDFFLLLMERAGKQVSINKVAHILDISPDTAKRYLQLFASTYLIYLVPRCGKTNERILSPKKVYAGDIGMRAFFMGFRDKGSLFENYVYLNIKHRSPCYVYQNGIEIDFLTQDKTLIEVKYNSKMSAQQKKLFERVRRFDFGFY